MIGRLCDPISVYETFRCDPQIDITFSDETPYLDDGSGSMDGSGWGSEITGSGFDSIVIDLDTGSGAGTFKLGSITSTDTGKLYNNINFKFNKKKINFLNNGKFKLLV